MLHVSAQTPGWSDLCFRLLLSFRVILFPLPMVHCATDRVAIVTIGHVVSVVVVAVDSISHGEFADGNPSYKVLTY